MTPTFSAVRLMALRLAEREIAYLAVREQLEKGLRIDHRTREVVLAQAAGLLEHADVEVAERAVGPGQRGELDGARQSCRTGPDEQHVHLDGL